MQVESMIVYYQHTTEHVTNVWSVLSGYESEGIHFGCQDNGLIVR